MQTTNPITESFQIIFSTNKISSYEHLNEVFNLSSNNLFLNGLIFLIKGWVSIFMAFYISYDHGLALIKLHFSQVIFKIFLRTMPNQFSLFLFRLNNLSRLKLFNLNKVE